MRRDRPRNFHISPFEAEEFRIYNVSRREFVYGWYECTFLCKMRACALIGTLGTISTTEDLNPTDSHLNRRTRRSTWIFPRLFLVFTDSHSYDSLFPRKITSAQVIISINQLRRWWTMIESKLIFLKDKKALTLHWIIISLIRVHLFALADL